MPAVIVDDLRKAYGDVTAVDGLSLAAAAGEVTAVLGPNGAGKTTTLAVCEGLRRRDSGRVEVLGQDPGTARGRRVLKDTVGVMPQSTGAPPGVRVGELLGAFAALHAHPQQLGGAPVAGVGLVVAEHARDDGAVGAVVDEAVHRGDGAFERDDHLVHRQRLGVTREAVAAVRAACRLDDLVLLEQRDDPLEVGERKPFGLRDRLERDGLRRAVGALVAPELDEKAYSVFRLCREDHRAVNPTNAVGVGGPTRPPDAGWQDARPCRS